MTALNFHEHDDDATIAIRCMARDDYDRHPDRAEFPEALDRRGQDEELRRAVEELGEEEAERLYDETYDDMEDAPWLQ
jgi:hypothetical protein